MLQVVLERSFSERPSCIATSVAPGMAAIIRGESFSQGSRLAALAISLPAAGRDRTLRQIEIMVTHQT